jgi:hypothetical protein
MALNALVIMFNSKSQFATCARKTPYATAAEAEQAVDGKFAAYLCPICGRYHLTSRRKATKSDPSFVDEKPAFDNSLVITAKLKRPKPDPAAQEVIGICLGKCAPDGRVRVKANGKEFLAGPVQPAATRSLLKSGVKVKLKVKGSKAEFLGLK